MDFTAIALWWFTILVIGLIGWTVSSNLLRFLPDRGFAFARPVGLLLSSYILWLGGTFRLLQNNSGGIVVSMLLVLTIGLVWQRQARPNDSPSMLAWLRQEWRYALSVELLFNLAFIGWVIFKAYNPNIETAGGEKWMEIAFVNGTLGSNYFPPQDPWLSGFAISYYYFGYVFMALVTRLTGLVSTIAFNLYIPTLFAMTLAAALGIIANLVSLHQWPVSPVANFENHLSPALTQTPKLNSPAIATGLVASLFVAVLGNLEGFLEVLHKRGLLSANFWIWLDIRDLKVPPTGPSASWIPDRFIWWWRGSRVLTDYTLTGQEQEVIDEFPFFSFLLGDVHPHVLALPFVLLAVALALNILANPQLRLGTLASNTKRDAQPSTVGDRSPVADGPWTMDKRQRTKNIVDKFWEILQNSWNELATASGGRLAFVLYAIFVGGLSFLNTWDFPIYLSVIGLVFIVWLRNRRDNFEQALLPGILGTGILGLTGVVLYFPFYATFQSQARGILPNLWNPTRLPQFVVFFGPFLIAAIGLMAVLSGQDIGWKKHIGRSMLLTVLGPVVIMLVALSTVLINPVGREYVQGILNNPDVQQFLGGTTVRALIQESLLRRVKNPWTFLLLGSLLGWALALAIGFTETNSTGRSKAPGDRLAEKFVIILLLVGLVLPLAVEFIYLRDNFGIRMNTVFKFYFQAWVLLALAAAFAVYYLSNILRGFPAIAWQVGMAALVAGGMVYPVLALPDKANYFQNEPTLNGIQWVAEYRPGDYAAIEWLQANATGGVILEAPGSHYAAYQYTGRISALTGLPTLLGWGGHESQWRGNYDEPARREPEIELLFNTVDLPQTQALLDKYDITYVYIGPLERERYSPAGLNKFVQLMDVAFQNDDVTIYER